MVWEKKSYHLPKQTNKYIIFVTGKKLHHNKQEKTSC